MKLKKLLFAAFFAFVVNGGLAAAVLPPPLDDAHPYSIGISSLTTWSLTIYYDGSGSLTVGAADLWTYPKGTFPFAEAYKHLVSVAKAEIPDHVPATHVHFSVEQGKEYTAFYIEDKDRPYLLTLFNLAASSKSDVGGKAELDRCMKANPFLPKN